MLVLSRKENQSIVIGDDIEVFIIRISSNRVRFGIKAPKGVPIYRQEVVDAIRRDQEQKETD